MSLKAIYPHHPFAIDEAFPTTADSLALGCVLAMTRNDLMELAPYRKLMTSRGTPWAVLLTICVAHALDKSASLSCLFGVSLENLAMAVLIDWAVRNPGGAFGSFLNSKPVALVGTWSYSIYLWQQPFLNPHEDGALQAFPLNLLLAILCAVTSFYVIERPSLRLRESLEKRFLPSAKRAATV